MENSQYLAQALLNLRGGDSTPPNNAGPSLQQMQQVGQQRQAFEVQNPGQSYMAHGIQQAGQNLMQAPQNAMSGLQRLAQRFAAQPGPMAGQTPPY